MKVSDLFEAEKSGGAFYSPHYDDKVGHQRGSVIDWMKELGISKEDIAKALAELKKSAEFRAMESKGFKYVSKPDSEKRGTIWFQVTKEYPGYVAGGKPINYEGFYQIFANGLIRSAISTSYDRKQVNTTPLKSPKPVVRPGDMVGSLVRIYKASMKALVDSPRRNNKKPE